MVGKYPSEHPLSLLTPLFILGIPIFDTLFVMYIRYLRGLPIFWGSPDHIAIRLRHWGLSVRQIVAVSYAATALVGGIGLAMMTASPDAAWAICLGTAGTLVGATFALQRIDVRKPLQQVVTGETGQGTPAA